MTNSIRFLLAAFLLVFAAPAQIGVYDGPFGPAYGYTPNGTLLQFGAAAQGQAPLYHMVTPNSTLSVFTSQRQANIVFLVTGLDRTAQWITGTQYQLVDTIINTSVVPPVAGTGGGYVYQYFFPNNPALVGLDLYYQYAHFYTNNPFNEFVVTNGVHVHIQ